MNKLIFLGTGSASHATRQMTSILFVIGDRAILLDCGDGMGTVRNIIDSGVSLDAIEDVVLTHHHADHVVGMPHFLFVKMLRDQKSKIRIIGPAKTLSITKTISFLTHDATRERSSRIAFVPMKAKQTVRICTGVFLTSGKMILGENKSARGFG